MTVPTPADDSIAALEQHARAVNEALFVAIDHIRALALVNAALMASLDTNQRTIIKEAALLALRDGSQHLATRALVEALLQEPADALAEHQVAGAPSKPSCRLQ